jgi:DNA-directed RNA polymerase subunit beta'
MPSEPEDFSAVRIRLASPAQMLSWSYGEVCSADTIHYRTHKPVKDGLFCERIFGPIKDWRCACGKYTFVRVPGFLCEKCGVELAPARVRRERMGHIALAVPVVHYWYGRGSSNQIALLLDLSKQTLDGLIFCNLVAITAIDEEERQRELNRLEPPLDAAEDNMLQKLRTLEVGQLMDLAHARDLQMVCHSAVFETASGGEAVRMLLGSLDLDALARDLHNQVHEGDANLRNHAIKRLRVVESLRTSKVDPTWMVLTVLPVLPPDLRPLVPVANGRLATSDVNALYARIIHRNNRIKYLLEHEAPAIILDHEKRLLQHACDALFDNAHTPRPQKGGRNQPLKSLTDTISGKMGRFRRDLLGKRVDFSGRSVICVGLELQLHQCGLPKKIALELFKPFIIQKLLEGSHAVTVRTSKRMVERRSPIVWEMLAEVMEGKVVLLNRAPTLHRLSIQAFEPVLVEGGAIRLHPLVCSAFNADFDGDQMAVHLPLSPAAQQEARELMLSTRNLRNPATGDPSISVSQDMVLGCFYLTQERPGKQGEGRRFATSNEAVLAYQLGKLDLQARIEVCVADDAIALSPPPDPPQAHIPGKRLTTTVGRLLFNEVLPADMRFRNYAMKKDSLKQIVAECLNRYGAQQTSALADALKRLGFAFATRSGISFAISDIEVPEEKSAILVRSDAQVADIRRLYQEGMITEQERYQQVVGVWQAATEEVSTLLEKLLDPYGSISTIAKSGATKAKFQQIRQLSGMRGLMASPSGRIIEVPIRSNYLEGLMVAEYIIGAHGARKGTMDRSLNTAKSGYRTIILVEVGQQVSVTQKDCGTTDGVLITEEESRQAGLPNMRSRLSGRLLAEKIDELGITVAAGEILTETVIDQLLAAGIAAVRVRSPLSCQAPRGICSCCYGLDLSTAALVQVGAAVGIIAAQSIGEPGTQLTMRTFHSGGIAGAQGDITQGLPRVEELFEVRVPRSAAVLAEQEGVVILDEAFPDEIRVQTPEMPSPACSLSAGSQAPLHNSHPINHSQCLAHDATHQPLLIPGGSESVQLGPGSHMALSTATTNTHVYALPPGRKPTVVSGQYVTPGTPLTGGPINPHELLRCAGMQRVQRYLVQEIQGVYRTAGVYLHDKHVELIVRQMTRWVQVDDEGDASLLIPGDLVDRDTFELLTTAILAQGGSPPTAHPMLRGTMKVALASDNWLAAASFQQTARILASAALAGQINLLRSYKDHVLVGRRIPHRRLFGM